MKKINMRLANCYGIKKLEHELDFTKHSCCLLYASNGTMKTSFAKTFKALATGKKPSDEIFNRPTTCVIKKDDGNELSKNEIFVIHSYEDEYVSQSTAKLVVNQRIKNQIRPRIAKS